MIVTKINGKGSGIGAQGSDKTEDPIFTRPEFIPHLMRGDATRYGDLPLDAGANAALLPEEPDWLKAAIHAAFAHLRPLPVGGFW